MNKLELKALQEAYTLLNSFESYKFYDLVVSVDNPDLLKRYKELSKEQHTKVDQAKYWLDAVLSGQKNNSIIKTCEL